MGKALGLRRKANSSITAEDEFINDSKAFTGRKISVFVPVYKSSELLDALLEKLTHCAYENKEIFVVIDEPDEKSVKVIKKYGGKANFLLSNKRRGKVEALNNAIKISEGKILVFIDSDVQLKGDDFLELIEREIGEAEILDVKKEIINDSFISRMVNYEYVSSNLVSYLYSKLVQKCIGINGAAFAIKREAFEEIGGFSRVISEDFDLAAKALLKNKKFKYTQKVEVYTKAPSSWRRWLTQRKRWGIGAGLWLKDYWRKFLRYVAKYPHIAIPSLIILFPTFIPVIFNYFFTTFLGYKIPNFLPSFFVMHSSLLIPFIPYIGELLLTSLTTIFLSFLLFSILFYAASKRLKLRFNLAEFLIYFLFYQPLSSLILFIGIITAFFSGRHELDWKV
jgi:cellulose synthase/poly-beta-1,6-N-acetylglucosamine synthase-like glycosyltransferase